MRFSFPIKLISVTAVVRVFQIHVHLWLLQPLELLDSLAATRTACIRLNGLLADIRVQPVTDDDNIPYSTEREPASRT